MTTSVTARESLTPTGSHLPHAAYVCNEVTKALASGYARARDRASALVVSLRCMTATGNDTWLRSAGSSTSRESLTECIPFNKKFVRLKRSCRHGISLLITIENAECNKKNSSHCSNEQSEHTHAYTHTHRPTRQLTNRQVFDVWQ